MSDGSVTLDTRLAYDQLKKDLKELKTTISKSLPSASSSLSAMSKGFENVGKAAMTAGKACTAMTAGLIGGLGIAISRFDTLNNYPKVLSNLGFSAEEAEKSIQDLSKGIDGLPTALDDAASGVQRLVAKNNNIEKSTKYFLAMNDAIVAGNAPAEQQASAIEQLTQAYSKGKPDLMEWRTLMMAMPGQLKQIAISMGYVSADSLYEALNKGKVSMDTFMDAVVKLDEEGADGIISFQEQARNSCDSIGTAITNVSNRFKKGFATILGSMNEAAKDTSFGSVAGMINNFSNSIKNFLDKIGGAIKENEAFKTFLNQISNALKKLNDTVNGLSSEQLDRIVTSIINLIKAGPILLGVGKGCEIASGGLKILSGGANLVEKAFDGVISIGGKMSGTAKSIANVAKNSEYLKKQFAGFATVGVVRTNMALDTLKTKFPVITKSINGLGNGVKKITSKFPSLSKKIGEFSNKVVSGFLKMSSVIGKSLLGIAPAILRAFSFGAVIGLVIAGLGLLQTNFGDKISEIANVMINQGPTIINNLINGILTNLPKLMEQGTQLLLTILDVITINLPLLLQGGMQIIMALANGILTSLPSMMSSILGIITNIVQTLIDNLPQIIETGVKILCALVEGIANELPTLIPMALDLIITLVMSLLDNIDQLVDTGIKLIVGLAEGLIKAIPRLIEKAPTIISKLINAIAKNFPKIVATGIKLIVELAGGLIQAIPQLVSKIPEIIGAIVNGFKEGMGSIIEVGGDIIKGLWEGIKGAGNWIKEKVGDFAKGILDGMKEALGIHSPSRLFRDEVGKYIALGVGEGFIDNIAKVYKKMKASVDFETQRISTNLSTTATIKAQNSGTKTIYNNNDNGISVNQNFYEKNQSPYEIGKETKNSLRRFAYGY